MTTLRSLLVTCGVLALAGCGGASPLSDPRDQPFRVLSDMPTPPNVERAADASGCSGAQLSAVEARLPDYPARGWSRGLQGWTVVQFDVTETGATDQVHVARGVPGGSFNTEAERAVRGWRFAPLEPGSRLTGCVVLFEFTQGLVRVR
ncbi:energy transducer TonB [Hyphomonadaceae bacterium BL14]|nr:energy transducer TonB [Hyphomonadaceae bacterium BL14]